jgi:hypothetical protein
MKGLFLLILGLGLAPEIYAFRSAVFPKRFESRAVFFPDFEKFLKSDTNTQRPIWIHGGDSLSTGWAHAATLLDRVELIRQENSPDAGSADDLKLHAPRTDFFTWYGGSETEMGLLDFFESSTKSEWLTLSTALTGAFLSEPGFDNLESMQLKSKQQKSKQNPILTEAVKKRIRLVSFSLGANDICELRDPTLSQKAGQPALKSRLEKFKKSFSSETKIIVWAPPRVDEMKKNIFALIERVFPNTPQKKELLAYCKAIWTETFCYGGTQENLRLMNLIQGRILKDYKDAGFLIFDPFEGLFEQENLTDIQKLELIGSDCFHPSYKAHSLIFEKLKNFIESETPDVLKP